VALHDRRVFCCGIGTCVPATVFDDPFRGEVGRDAIQSGRKSRRSPAVASYDRQHTAGRQGVRESSDRPRRTACGGLLLAGDVVIAPEFVAREVSFVYSTWVHPATRAGRGRSPRRAVDGPTVPHTGPAYDRTAGSAADV